MIKMIFFVVVLAIIPVSAFAESYQFLTSDSNSDIVRQSDGKVIPNYPPVGRTGMRRRIWDPDYIEYLKWLKDGNTTLPSDK